MSEAEVPETTQDQLRWIMHVYAAEAGLDDPEAEAPHLESWAFPDHAQALAYASLRVARGLLHSEVERCADLPAEHPLPATPRIGPHRWIIGSSALPRESVRTASGRTCSVRTNSRAG